MQLRSRGAALQVVAPQHAGVVQQVGLAIGTAQEFIGVGAAEQGRYRARSGVQPDILGSQIRRVVLQAVGAGGVAEHQFAAGASYDLFLFFRQHTDGIYLLGGNVHGVEGALAVVPGVEHKIQVSLVPGQAAPGHGGHHVGGVKTGDGFAVAAVGVHQQHLGKGAVTLARGNAAVENDHLVPHRHHPGDGSGQGQPGGAAFAVVGAVGLVAEIDLLAGGEIYIKQILRQLVLPLNGAVHAAGRAIAIRPVAEPFHPLDCGSW